MRGVQCGKWELGRAGVTFMTEQTTSKCGDVGIGVGSTITISHHQLAAASHAVYGGWGRTKPQSSTARQTGFEG